MYSYVVSFVFDFGRMGMTLLPQFTQLLFASSPDTYHHRHTSILLNVFWYVVVFVALLLGGWAVVC